MWRLAWAMAEDRPIFGGGMWWMKNFALRDAYARSANLGPPPAVGAAHSIFFENLGDHGFIGFVLYFSLVFVAYRNGRWLARHASGEDDEWALQLGRMIPASLIGYLVGGAFVTVSTYEGYYQLFIIIAAARSVLEAKQGPWRFEHPPAEATGRLSIEPAAVAETALAHGRTPAS